MPEEDLNRLLAKWLAEARGGSREALGQALEACRHYLLSVANDQMAAALRAKAGASDLVQETFLEAQRRFPSFHGGSPDALMAWLRQILLHNMEDLARRYRLTEKRELQREVPLRLPASTDGPEKHLLADTPTPSSQAMRHEEESAVRRALDRLPEPSRQVVILRHRENLSFEEISQALGRSEAAVRKMWFRALESLARELGG
jgi:RNA polymerase sigma-70 factor (ECF subfamily)